MKININPLSKKSLNDIQELDKRFKSPWSEELYLERLELFPQLALGAYNSKDKLIGFILGKTQYNGSIFISRIVVAKSYEGKGIGTKLIGELSKRTSENKLESTVRKSNIRGLLLHSSTGFKLLTTEQNMFEDGEAGMIFEKRM